MIYPKQLENIIEYYKKLPGIGEKSAERMALSTLEMPMEQVEDFSIALVEAKNNLKPCKKYVMYAVMMHVIKILFVL